MARFPEKQAKVVVLAQVMESNIYYARNTVNKVGDGEPFNIVIVVL